MTDDTKTEIRNLIESWARDERAKDIEGVPAHHAADMVMFDVPPPATVKGLDAYRKTRAGVAFAIAVAGGRSRMSIVRSRCRIHMPEAKPRWHDDFRSVATLSVGRSR